MHLPVQNILLGWLCIIDSIVEQLFSQKVATVQCDENILQCGNNSAKKIKDVHLVYAALKKYKARE